MTRRRGWRAIAAAKAGRREGPRVQDQARRARDRVYRRSDLARISGQRTIARLTPSSLEGSSTRAVRQGRPRRYRRHGPEEPGEHDPDAEGTEPDQGNVRKLQPRAWEARPRRVLSFPGRFTSSRRSFQSYRSDRQALRRPSLIPRKSLPCHHVIKRRRPRPVGPASVRAVAAGDSLVNSEGHVIVAAGGWSSRRVRAGVSTTSGEFLRMLRRLPE